jgi:pimeloyl-ACP methyl ester carboxylesterase
VHYVGLSMGGMVGMRVAARRPDLVRSLVLLDTSAEAEDATARRRYGTLVTAARVVGIRALVGRVMPILFGRSALADPDRRREVAAWRAAIAGNRRDVVRAVLGVTQRTDCTHELAAIRCPTLVVVGDEDVATPPATARRIAEAIPGARLVTIARAGHSAPVEQPAAVTDAIRAFLDAQPR